MRIRHLLLSLAMVVVGLIPASMFAQSIVIDDFNDGNDAGWERRNNIGGAGPVYSFEAGAYHMASTDAVAPHPFNQMHSRWLAADNQPQFGNGFFRAKVRVDEPGGTYGLLMRFNAPPAGDSYGMWASSVLGTFYIDVWRRPMPLQQIIATGNPATLSFSVGEDWLLEGGTVGDQISLKAWKVGDPEPASPQLLVTDSLIGPEFASGLALIGSVQDANQPVSISGSFDDLTFTPIPEPTTGRLAIVAVASWLIVRRSRRRRRAEPIRASLQP